MPKQYDNLNPKKHLRDENRLKDGLKTHFLVEKGYIPVTYRDRNSRPFYFPIEKRTDWEEGISWVEGSIKKLHDYIKGIK
jgi:hypothetical protein|tara:strand:+ start:1363 stop:1602 length:240 start_codon:yes stop_codon:yes gene_type:complete